MNEIKKITVFEVVYQWKNKKVGWMFKWDWNQSNNIATQDLHLEVARGLKQKKW